MWGAVVLLMSAVLVWAMRRRTGLAWLFVWLVRGPGFIHVSAVDSGHSGPCALCGGRKPISYIGGQLAAGVAMMAPCCYF